MPDDKNYPVYCPGCGDEVAMFQDGNFATKLTDHDQGCDTHGWTRCHHKADCYGRTPNLENRSE